MPNKFVKESVDINLYPLITSVPHSSQLTIGDLHGNALKFLHFLIKYQIVTCPVHEYLLFKQIYTKPVFELTMEDLFTIISICDNLKIKNKTHLCLIGDELADRGQNDFFMLMLFNKLHKESVSFDILLSNHGYMFIECLENGADFYSKYECGNQLFGCSMFQMQYLINANMINAQHIRQIAKTAYLPHLKLLSYTLDSDNEITLYHHAAIDEMIIDKIAQKLNVPFNASSVKTLAKTIDAINFSFQNHYVKENAVSKLVIDFDGSLHKNEEDPIAFLFWNRNYAILKQSQRPYKVNHVHGHDSKGPVVEGVYCLNDMLGCDVFFTYGDFSLLIAFNEKVILEQLKEARYVNSFFYVNGHSLTENKVITHPLSFQEDNKENYITFTL